MKLKELAEILGKDVFEVAEMLRKQNSISIKLSERETKPRKDNLRIMKV